MADNIPVSDGVATYTAATDKVTYSGDADVDVQLVKPVAVTGAEGSKTVVDIFGTAGTASAAVVSVQGIASGTALPISDNGGTVSVDDGAGSLTVDGTVTVQDGGGAISVDDGGGSLTVDGTVSISGAVTVGSHAVTNDGTFAVQVDAIVPGNGATNLGKAEDAAHTSGDTGVMSLAVRRALTPTDRSAGATDGDYEPLQVDGNGRLYNNSAIYTPAGDSAMDETNDAVRVAIVADTVGSSVDTEDGTVAAGASNVAQVIAQAYHYDGSNWVRKRTAHLIDDAAFTPTSDGVIMAGFEADEASTDSVDAGDAGAARMTLDRKQIVTLQPHTSGGLSTFMASGSDGSTILQATAQAIKASAGQMYGYYLYNPETSVTFVHFYNTAAASVTVGTTNPLFTIPVPAGAAANLMFPHGVTFSNTGWSCAATTTAGGNTSPSTGVSAVIWYS